MRSVLVFVCLVGMACAFSVSARRGGTPGLAGAAAGLLPSHPFPQVKSWLRRPKLDDSEENAVFKSRHRHYLYRYIYAYPPQRRYQGSDSSEEEGDGSEEEEGGLLTSCPVLSLSLQEPFYAGTKAAGHPAGAAPGDCQGALGGDRTASKGEDSENEDSDENEEEEEEEEVDENENGVNGTSTNTTEGIGPHGNGTAVAEEGTGEAEEEEEEE
ncbi:SIAL protein, partial [Hirundo rustica]|nr:SIAL protein [Hirundo rustica]